MSIVSEFLLESVSIKQRLSEDSEFLSTWNDAATALKSVVGNDGCIYICGNGGSACDAMHFREELVARYKRERKGIRANHLADSSTITCWSNDYGYDGVFTREIDTFVKSNDCLVAISTSGNSKNVIQGVLRAKELGAVTIGLLGKEGGELKELVDFALVVPSSETDRIQEVHITLIHAFCEFLET